MKKQRVVTFILGMLTFAVGSFLISTFIFVERPMPPGDITDWQQICFWPEADGLYAAISPKGCYSTTCTRPVLQEGTAIVDMAARKIQLTSRFVLAKTSRFPLPCIENCAGGGTVHFVLEDLIPNDYEVWFRDEKVGMLKIYSGRPTPRQCFGSAEGG